LRRPRLAQKHRSQLAQLALAARAQHAHELRHQRLRRLLAAVKQSLGSRALRVVHAHQRRQQRLKVRWSRLVQHLYHLGVRHGARRAKTQCARGRGSPKNAPLSGRRDFSMFGAAAPAFGGFGGAAAAAPSPAPFGAAFGAAPAASPASAFGTAPAFGASPAPAFGAAPAAGANPFGASPAAQPFGAAPAAQQPAASPFGGGAFGAGGAFGTALAAQPAATPAFGGFGGAFGGGAFGGSTAAQSFFQQAPAAAAPRELLTTARRPITHADKWDDLAEETKQRLLAIECVPFLRAGRLLRGLTRFRVAACRARLHQNRESCDFLSNTERLKASGPGSSKEVRPSRAPQEAAQGLPLGLFKLPPLATPHAPLLQSLEARAGSLQAVISRLGAALGADREAMQSLREGVMRALRDADAAVAAYERARLRREANAAAASGAALAPDVRARLAVTGRAPTPSPVLVEATPALEQRLAAYLRQIAELDALLLRPGRPGASAGGATPSTAEAVRTILENTHQYMLQVAARVSASHEAVASARERCQAALRARGRAAGGDDPFAAAAAAEKAEAERAEAAPQFAASPAPTTTAPPPSAATGLAAQPAAAAAPSAFSLTPIATRTTPAPLAPAAAVAPLSPLAPVALNFAAPTPAPTPPAAGAGIFGGATAAPSPAPAAGGGLFGLAGGAPAASPVAGFGATPAASPGIFGAAPAAAGFGTPAATPAAPFGSASFGAAAAGGFGTPAAGATQLKRTNSTATTPASRRPGGRR
jgi:hypothetical protein